MSELIPTEDVTEGWYVAKCVLASSEGRGWTPAYVRAYNIHGDLAVDSMVSVRLEDWQFHSRIPMPDETPEERKDGK